MSSDPAQHYRDILSAITDIESFTAGMSFDEFRSAPVIVAAVERKLLVIAEAATRLRGQHLPDYPWSDIRGMGNWIRHQYDRVDLVMIWNTVSNDLPTLKAVVQPLAYPQKPPQLNM